MRSLLRSLTSLVPLLLAILALSCIARADFTTIVNNDLNTQSAAIDVIQKQGVAQAFKTDGRVYNQTTVGLVLLLPASGSETVEIELYANDDAKNAPGDLLFSQGPVTITSTTPGLITATANQVLSPNTQYWVVVRAVSGGQVNWSETSDTSLTGVGTIGQIFVTDDATKAQPAWKARSNNTGILRFAVTANTIPPTLVAGAGSGGQPLVNVFDPAHPTQPTGSVNAFAATFTGGVRVAAADFDGDGIPDTVVGAGPGGGPQVKVLSGSDGSVMKSFIAFAPTFTGGVYVAAGDVNGDGVPDIIVGADAGGSPQVKVFNGKSGAQFKSFFAFDQGFSGGVRVAAADVDGDGCADIIAGAGPGGGPIVDVFSGKTGKVIASFFAYDPSFQGGIFVAAGDVDGDGYPDIVTGTDGQSTAVVKVFHGPTFGGTQSLSPTGFTGGVRVAVGNLSGDSAVEIILGSGAGGTPRVQTYSGPGLSNGAEASFNAFASDFTGGVYVAGTVAQRSELLAIGAAGAGTGKVTGKFLRTIVHASGGNEVTFLQPSLTEAVTLTATPDKGSAFAGWTDANGTTVGFDQTSTFRMYEGLALKANFIAAPFDGLDGTYDGVIVFDNSSTRGSFTAKIGNTGTLAVKLQIGTPSGVEPVAISTRLLGTGEFQRVIPVEGIGPMELDFQVDTNPVAGTPQTITGTLTQIVPGATTTPQTASFTAKREEFQDGGCPAAGNYTMRLTRGNFASDTFPAGISGVSVKVTDKGRATFTGLLGDGTRVTAGFQLAEDGDCAFFLPLYGKKGYLAGTLHFDATQSDSDIDGTLTWVKLDGLKSSKTYLDGFADDVTALGTFYVPPPAIDRLIPTSSNGACTVILDAPATTVKVGSQSVDLPIFNGNESVTLDVDDFLHIPADALALKCTLKRKTGIFSGSFKETVWTKAATVAFTGIVILPKGGNTGEAAATFVLGDHSGQAILFAQ